jgi:hypothetical protein
MRSKKAFNGCGRVTKIGRSVKNKFPTCLPNEMDRLENDEFNSSLLPGNKFTEPLPSIDTRGYTYRHTDP